MCIRDRANITASWVDIGYPAHLSAKIRDLWEHQDIGEQTGSFSASVPSHGVVMVTIKP